MPILADAHVHIYPCFELAPFFDHAFANFKAAALEMKAASDFSPVLFLTDWARQRWFAELADHAAAGESVGNWNIRATGDAVSLYAQKPDGEGFYLMAGRKIITAENLELLGLFTYEPFEDGHPLDEMVAEVWKKGGIPVVPWAVGKWLGSRGEVLKKLLETAKPRDLFLCDNANRPFFWPRPALFELADRKGIPVLAGSDPLHFASEIDQAGSYGFTLSGNLSSDSPGKEFADRFTDPNTRFGSYGDQEGPFRFFKNQMIMQLMKKTWRKELADV